MKEATSLSTKKCNFLIVSTRKPGEKTEDHCGSIFTRGTRKSVGEGPSAILGNSKPGSEGRDRAGPLGAQNTHLPLYRVAFLFIVLFNSWKCQDVKSRLDACTRSTGLSAVKASCLFGGGVVFGLGRKIAHVEVPSVASHW